MFTGVQEHKISVVIPVADDYLLARCIDSVDDNAEIVVVLNGSNSKFRRFVWKLQRMDHRVVVYSIQRRSIGAARELGCQKASGDYLVMMDSDCVFERGCMGKLLDGLRDSDFAKGRIIYQSRDFITSLVAKARRTHSSGIHNTYTPFLAFRKSVLCEIGGYYFSTKIPWTEDHELSQRITRYGLTVNPVASAIGYHEPTTIKDDLKSAMNYGIGYNFGIRVGQTTPDLLYGGAPSFAKSMVFDLRRAIKTLTYIRSMSRRFDILTALYMTLWMMTFSLGYYIGYFKRLQV